MKSIILCFIVLFLAISVAITQSDKFRYQPKKLDVGTLYHYIKIDKNNHNPEKIAVYFASTGSAQGDDQTITDFWRTVNQQFALAVQNR